VTILCRSRKQERRFDDALTARAWSFTIGRRLSRMGPNP
jgi:hypothetical protein